jgi:zinc transport system substrate-binding protein
MSTATWGRCAVGVLLLAALGACSKSAANPERAPAVERVIYTSFYPATYFTERIAGGALPVVCPLPEGEDPIFWQPSRDVLGKYQSAALIVLNGAGLEPWVETAALPRSRVVVSARPLEGELITIEGVRHSHGPVGAHTHSGLDGHTWLDPVNARLQALEIEKALAARFATEAVRFELGPALSGVTILCSHPAYNYLARRYGWTIENVDLDPEAVIEPEALSEIAARRPAGGRTILLWESEPLASTADRLERLQIRSVVFSPAENLERARRAAGEDYLTIMHANIDRLAAAVQ